jgi:4-amino-4-deoxy-L-arabinose transferase-like glycosyltransferase
MLTDVACAALNGESSARALPPRAAALVLGLIAALLLFRLGAVPLLGPDEPRYTRVAVEMHRSRDFVTPTLQGRPWLEKPALYYWLAAAAMDVRGETETAARLPSALAALLMAGATAVFGARVYGARAGLWAALVCGTGVLAFAYGRAASMDMLLAATVTAATALVGLRLLDIAGRLAVPAAGALCGLAVLAKGPLGLLLPGLAVLGWLAATRDRHAARRLLSPMAALLFLAVAGPWYLLVYRAQGQAFVDVFLLDHNVRRFTSTIHRHPGPPWYYVPVLLGGLFPWTGLLVPALAQVRARRDRADLFVLSWLVLPLLFFSAAGSKLPGYILPCLPPLALWMGRAAERMARAERATPEDALTRRVMALVTLGFSALVAALPLVLARQGEPLWRLTVPLAAWSLMVGWMFSRRLGRDPDGALRLLRVGAAGLLLLLALAAPPLLEKRESGRALFGPAAGREVLVWGAWRTAWMAGYFYNDARVREAPGLEEIARAAASGPVLVLCGPGERRLLQRARGLSVQVLATGPRGNVLVDVRGN